jgi:hypothetical protein
MHAGFAFVDIDRKQAFTVGCCFKPQQTDFAFVFMLSNSASTVIACPCSRIFSPPKGGPPNETARISTSSSLQAFTFEERCSHLPGFESGVTATDDFGGNRRAVE